MGDQIIYLEKYIDSEWVQGGIRGRPGKHRTPWSLLWAAMPAHA